jgi:subtilisin family serine protease
MKRLVAWLVLAVAIVTTGGVPDAGRPAPTAGRTEVVVALEAPPLALAPAGSKRIEEQQAAFRSALAERIPDARVRWRYRLVQDGFAVMLPSRDVGRLRALPGVRDVYPSAQYGPALDISPQQIGAPTLWGPGLATAGQGIKIGIIDSGVDFHHVFFNPKGFTMPAGFPKGQKAYTTAKVIVARAFPPPGAPAGSGTPFSSRDISHGTHVAGIAAGDANTDAGSRRIVSGIAPKAYIGNYKVFVPTISGLSPNANSPEIVAAIEAAVADGMDVINFSGGEPEIEPSRDIVARALDAAAAAGVVPVVAAGNAYLDVGAGSVSSPGTSSAAITVGAVAATGVPPVSMRADFSSVGPTPISLRLKPDVVAPGVNILSSIPGGWSRISGTSMASPHVAGAAALLRQRHPGWTVAQVKSTLVETGVGVRFERGGAGLAPPQDVGGGLIFLPAADQPLIFTQPSGLSFGLPQRGSDVTRTVQLSDAGGGTGTWQVFGEAEAPGSRLTVPATVSVPGQLPVELTVSSSASEGVVSGLIVLRRGDVTRHIPYWGRVSIPRLSRHSPLPLTRTGLHNGSTVGQPSYVPRYRYPEDPRGLGLRALMGGPEVVYSVRIPTSVANFGVVVTKESRNASVQPRIVAGLDENRLTGDAALPSVGNPYLPQYGAPVLVAGALSPRAGEYGIVFDSPRASGAGRFRFRYWVNDVTPPTVRLTSKKIAHSGRVVLTVTDKGSGIYPPSIAAFVDGETVGATYARGRVLVSTLGLGSGKHRLQLRVSDYQETRNTENVARILPNTRFFIATFTIRR